MAGIKIEQDNALELFFITVILSSFFSLTCQSRTDNHFSIVLLHDSCGCRYDISAVISILSMKITDSCFVGIELYFSSSDEFVFNTTLINAIENPQE